MINTPSIRLADYFLKFYGQNRPRRLSGATKKNASGCIYPGRDASNHSATRLSSPQRHEPDGFTSPFFGDFAPSLDETSQD